MGIESNHKWEWLNILSLLSVAAYFRLPGLGELGLYGDEDLTAMAVQGILSDGYPHMPSGMAYWRAFPYSYLAGGISWWNGLSELSIRLPSAIFGIVTILFFYQLSKRFTGKIPAVMAAWLLALSGWHIDLSREGRMYSMFLAFSLLTLLYFEKGFLQGKRGFQLGSVLVAVIMITLHKLSILVIGFWILTFVFQTGLIRQKYTFLGSTSLLTVFWYYYYRITKFKPPGVALVEELPGLIQKKGSVLGILPLDLMPNFSILNNAIQHHPVVIGTIVFLVLIFTWNILRKEAESTRLNHWLVRLAGFVLVSLGLFGLFGLIFLIGAGLALWKMEYVMDWLRLKLVRLLVMNVILLFIFWFIYGMIFWRENDGIISSTFQQVRLVIKDIVWFPAMHILVYLESFPMMTAVVCFGTILCVVTYRPRHESRALMKTVIIWFWIPLLMLGFIREWIALRYTLVLYPFYLMIFSWTFSYVLFKSKNVVVGWMSPKQNHQTQYPIKAATVVFVGILLFPVINEQHGIRAAMAWSQLTYGQKIQPLIHGFPLHPDHQGAGRFVRENLLESDIIVAMDVQQQTYYIGRTDYWLMESWNARRFSYFDGVDWRDIYTSSIVMNSLPNLKDLLESKGDRRLWLITSGELVGYLKSLFPKGVQEYLYKTNEKLKFSGRDGVTRAYLFN